MGGVHSDAYSRARRHYPDCAGAARLVLAADDSASRAARASDQLGYEGWTTDWREVVAHPEVEALSVTVPNDLHVDVALAAAAEGKHLWIEKPVGRFPHETAEIAAAVES